MDGVLCDFDKAAKELIRRGKVRQPWHCCSIKGFYRELEPIDGAIEAYQKLDNVYDVYILSTPSWGNSDSWSEKIDWVKQYLGKIAKKKVILCHNKSLVQGRYLIDDRTKNGAAEFQGELILFGYDKFPDWNSVLKYLL